jgi:hypothetical protein
MSRHLVVALTDHGYGHAAQTIAVLNALRERMPRLRVTLLTTLPQAFFAERLRGEFTLIARATDVGGMCMASAVDVRPEETRAVYARFHAGWEQRVTQEAEWLRELKPDLVLANVPYLPLAAARQAAIPAVAMCSLNWADLYQHYFGVDAIYRQMHEAYAAADIFLRLTPGMPMESLPNRRVTGPVARLGRDRRSEIRARLGVNDAMRLVLIAPGGMEWRLPIERWPAMPRFHLVVPASWRTRLPRVSALEELGMTFIDVLASSDAVVGKPGYGTFAEAACNGVPMLYVRRGDWPEEPYLVEWLDAHLPSRAIGRERLERGEFGPDLEALWERERLPPPEPTGVAQCGEILSSLLG